MVEWREELCSETQLDDTGMVLEPYLKLVYYSVYQNLFFPTHHLEKPFPYAYFFESPEPYF